jgi:hypothetical protein
MILTILYWIILILAILGIWAPEPYVRFVRGVDLILFVILGLKLFGSPLQ